MASAWHQELFYRQLGANIRKCRIRLNLSQHALGKLIGMTRTSLTNIENGRQHPPLHTFCQIVEQLKVDVSELLPRPLKPTEPDNQIRAMVRQQTHAEDERAFIEAAIGIRKTKRHGNPKKKN